MTRTDYENAARYLRRRREAQAAGYDVAKAQTVSTKRRRLLEAARKEASDILAVEFAFVELFAEGNARFSPEKFRQAAALP